MNLDLSKVSDSDYIPLVILKNCESEIPNTSSTLQ